MIKCPYGSILQKKEFFMRKLICMIGSLILIISFTSCGKDSSGTDVSGISGTTDTTNNNLTNPVGADKPEPSTDANSESDVAVIAKSGNAVSSRDKEAVISELDNELDSLFNSINDSKNVAGKDPKVN
jgi:hypothetical protein